MVAVTQLIRKHRHFLSIAVSHLTVEHVLRNDIQMFRNDDALRLSSDRRESMGVYLCGPKQASSQYRPSRALGDYYHNKLLYFYKIILPSEPSTDIPWELPLCI